MSVTTEQQQTSIHDSKNLDQENSNYNSTSSTHTEKINNQEKETAMSRPLP